MGDHDISVKRNGNKADDKNDYNYDTMIVIIIKIVMMIKVELLMVIVTLK